MIKQDIVAIIGRPNVGKSSLFNRLIGRREAIVDDEPGVTRDRHYAPVEWNSKSFILVDTGGYLPESSAFFDAAIREQVEIAIEQADLLLFVVDVKSGITNTDSDIARMIQQVKKPTMVIVNKVDDSRTENDIYEFYNLGLGEPYMISAMTGRNSGNILDDIATHIILKEIPEDTRIKLAVIGKENVGKSSYVNTLLGTNRTIVSEIPGTTRDAIDSSFTYFDQEFTIIDTAGLKRKTKVKENILFYSQLRTISSIERSDVVLYFIDAKEGITHQDQVIMNEVIDHRKGLIIVANKWDTIEDKTDKKFNEFIKKIRTEIPYLDYVPIITISALEKQRTYKVIEKAKEVFETKKIRIPTRKLNLYFEPILLQYNAPSSLGREVKINFITQVQANPPTIAFFSNRPQDIIVSYQRFLEKKFREGFPFEGVPVKLVFKDKNEKREKEFQDSMSTNPTEEE